MSGPPAGDGPGSALGLLMPTTEEEMKSETGAIGYILLWIMGIPASVLFVIFLLRGCN
jgi:hypothetical protein